jgi:hypothetical protein
MAARGERGALIVDQDFLTRLSSNPFFPYLLGRVDDGIDRPSGPSGQKHPHAALRRYKGTVPSMTLAVVDFADEEGARSSRSLLGSSAASGSLIPDSVRGLVDRQGTPLVEALAEISSGCSTRRS